MYEEEANDGKEKRKRPSRRRVLKTLAGLFAFIPAAKYLADASPAFAYVACTSLNCQETGTWDCLDPECTGHPHWYQLFACYDLRSGDFCWNEWIDSGEPC